MLISGQNYNVTNILADNYMRPDIYRVNGGLQDIHHSHFITAPGASLPLRLQLLNGGWDDSHQGVASKTSRILFQQRAVSPH